MKKLNNEKGLTLIEMLATITILFVLGGMVYAMLFQMFANFSSTENRSTARQEANLIIAQLTNIHQTSDEYTIEYESDNYFITKANGNSMRLGHKNYQYDLSVNGIGLEAIKDIPIYLQREHEDAVSNLQIPIILTLSNEHDSFTVTTTLSRMTTAN